MRRDFLVYASWSALKEPTYMGVLTANYLSGRESFAFECQFRQEFEFETISC